MLISKFGKNFTRGFNFAETNFQGFAKKPRKIPKINLAKTDLCEN